MSRNERREDRGLSDKDSRSRPTSYNPVETGRAWTHGFLNQKPWHPLSYRNQRRKYEVEQKHIELERRKEAAQKELEVEEEHYKSLSYLSSQDVKEYRDRQQLAFMYVKPPGMATLPQKQPHTQSEQAVFKERPIETRSAVYSEKGPMSTMLKGQAMCAENTAVLQLGMTAPHGGCDPKAENQQLLFSDGEDEEATAPSEKKKRKKKRLREKVKRAEAILSAAGFDVETINRQIERDAKKRRRREKPTTRTDEQGGYRKYVPSSAVSAKDLPGHTKLKFRASGQDSKDDLKERDLKAELEFKERKHFEERRQRDLLLLKETDNEPPGPLLIPMAADADEEDSPSEDNSEKESESESEDEEAELLAELERIKKEREEEARRKDEERRTREKEQEQKDMLTGNPLLNKPTDGAFNMKRRWDEDVIFKNQSRGEPKAVKRFINDTVRSDFHQKFLQRYIR